MSELLVHKCFTIFVLIAVAAGTAVLPGAMMAFALECHTMGASVIVVTVIATVSGLGSTISLLNPKASASVMMVFCIVL
jgi:hypothetical protein